MPNRTVSRRVAALEARRKACPAPPATVRYWSPLHNAWMLNVAGLCFPEVLPPEQWAAAAVAHQTQLLLTGVPVDPTPTRDRGAVPAKRRPAAPGALVAVIQRTTGLVTAHPRVDALEMVAGPGEEYAFAEHDGTTPGDYRSER